MSTASYKGLVLFKKIKAHHTFKEYDKIKKILCCMGYLFLLKVCGSFCELREI